MANPHRGSVALQAGDQAFTLSFSVNALCELEDLLNMPDSKIATTMNDPNSVRMSTVRALICGALRDHHPETDLQAAGDIASAAGIPACMEAVGKAFQLAFPQEEANSNQRPRKAKA